jgi:acyl-coenzyme A thioesterase PaaI-like protein
MRSSQYNFSALKVPITDVLSHLSSTGDTAAPTSSLIKKIIAECGIQPAQVSGPHSSDLNALHWPITPSAWTQNRHKSFHGGVAFMLVDALASLHLAAALGEYHHVTTNVQTTYVKAVQLLEPSMVKTTIVRAGAVACFLEVEIVDKDGSRLIKATVTKATLPKSSSL